MRTYDVMAFSSDTKRLTASETFGGKSRAFATHTPSGSWKTWRLGASTRGPFNVSVKWSTAPLWLQSHGAILPAARLKHGNRSH